MYISPEAPQGAAVSLGVLYPSSSAEDDYERLAERLGAAVQIDLVHTTVPEDAHREDALLETGNLARLVDPARELASRGASAIMWACTSGSFVFGLEGARAQARALEKATGVPTSSTSLAFVAALHTLDISRVALAATYPPDVTRMFADMLADAGVEVVGAASMDILTGAEVGRIERGRLLPLVKGADDAAAQAVLVPDTALHTIDLVDELDGILGKPVLTANQVTGWYGLKLAGVETAHAGIGALFMRESADVDGAAR